MVKGTKRKIKAKKKVAVKSKLNCIGYPHNDPYGLAAAFKLAFGFNNKKEKDVTEQKTKQRIKYSAKDFY